MKLPTMPPGTIFAKTDLWFLSDKGFELTYLIDEGEEPFVLIGFNGDYTNTGATDDGEQTVTVLTLSQAIELQKGLAQVVEFLTTGRPPLRSV